MECPLVLADDSSLGATVDVHENGVAIQRDFGTVDTRPIWHLMKFNKDKCKALHLRRKSTLQ